MIAPQREIISYEYTSDVMQMRRKSNMNNLVICLQKFSRHLSKGWRNNNKNFIIDDNRWAFALFFSPIPWYDKKKHS